MNPKVSVIIASYNRAAYLPATIESVLNQTFKDLELIVVDDGSTDNTAEVVRRFGDPVRYVYQTNAERGAARNHGLRVSRGEFIVFLDSDDIWPPEKLDIEMRALASEPHVGLVYSDVAYADANADVRSLLPVKRKTFDGDVLRPIAQGNFVTVGAHLIRKEAFVRAGGFNEDRTLSGSEDWEAWIRLAAVTPFRHVETLGLIYRLHAGGTVANPDGMKRSMLRACELAYENEALLPRIRDLRPRTYAYVHLTLSSLYHAAGRRREALEHLRMAAGFQPQTILTRRFIGSLARAIVGRDTTRRLRDVRARLIGSAH